MKRSEQRILTTHTGSLPRPADLVALISAKENGEPYDEAALRDRTRSAVREAVEQQAAAGIDVVSDGEYGKPGFFQYVRNRLSGFEGLNREARFTLDPDFPEFAAWRASHGFVGGPGPRPQCIGPLGWKDREALLADIA